MNKLIFPRAFAFAVDDLGWNEGSNLGENGGQGPYRIGFDRKLNHDDYRAIIAVGKSAGVRIQGLFVLCEMDRENVCARYPTTTMDGAGWDNSENVKPEQLEIINDVRDNAAYLEFGMHGVGHEYWPEKMVKVRAEWYNKFDKQPWPEDVLNGHFDCYRQILAQYGLSPEKGHSFPESFVPCAYSYYWNPEGEYSLGKLLHAHGIKYANTWFSEIMELNPPQEPNGGGFDHGVHVINRLIYGNEYHMMPALPTVPIELQESDIIESHWPNWLSAQPGMQSGITEKWIAYYKMVQQTETRYIAKNTEQLHSQWLYRKYAVIDEKTPGTVNIDNRNMDPDVYQFDLLGNLVLKIKLNAGQHVSNAFLNNELIAAYFEEAGFAFLYLPRLEAKRYVLTYTLDREFMPLHVYNDGTYNVYRLSVAKNYVCVDLKVYGTQVMKIKCRPATNVTVDNDHMTINNHWLDQVSGLLNIEISALNFQGERGIVTVHM